MVSIISSNLFLAQITLYSEAFVKATYDQFEVYMATLSYVEWLPSVEQEIRGRGLGVSMEVKGVGYASLLTKLDGVLHDCTRRVIVQCKAHR